MILKENVPISYNDSKEDHDTASNLYKITMDQTSIPPEDQTKTLDLIDITGDIPCLGSPSQLSTDVESAHLRAQASVASYHTDGLSSCQKSSIDLRPSHGASLISYGNPGECLSPCQQSASELGNGFVMPEIESFQNLGGVPSTPASSIFEDDFAASPGASSPVWSYCSGAADDSGRTFVTGAFSASPSSHFIAGNSLASSPPNLSTVPTAASFSAASSVAGLNSQFLTVNVAAPLAHLSELNHVDDSPSPVPSTCAATGVSGDHNPSDSCDRRRARISLQHLFDVEASAAPQQVDDDMSYDSEYMCTGYLNPMATFSDGDVKTAFDAIDGKYEAQSLMSYDTSPWKLHRQDGEAYPSPSATSFNTVISEGPICRICHEGEQASENLISPCRCTGTLQFLHRKCLEQWLQTKNKDVCELCNFEYRTRRKTRPFTEWFRHPSNPRDMRNFAVDFGCALVLTPMVTISAWLCLNGSSHYLHHQERSLEGVGLILLAVVLILIFSSWALLTSRYHYMVWREWSKHNQLVTVLTQSTHVTVTPLPVTSTPERGRNETSSTSVSVSKNSSGVEATGV